MAYEIKKVWIAEKMDLRGKWQPDSMDTNKAMLAANVSAWSTAEGGRWRIRRYVPAKKRGLKP